MVVVLQGCLGNRPDTCRSWSPLDREDLGRSWCIRVSREEHTGQHLRGCLQGGQPESLVKVAGQSARELEVSCVVRA